MSSDHAIGSRLSLISKSEIRYEGFLDFIDPTKNTVGLKNVVMHGTEGRRNGANEVPASTTAYDFIVFRGNDIKDLTVYEDDLQDPAILTRGPIGIQQQPPPQQQAQSIQPQQMPPQQQQQQQQPQPVQHQQQHQHQQQQHHHHGQRDRREDRGHGRRDDYHHGGYRGGYDRRDRGYYDRDGGRGGRGHRGGGGYGGHNNNNNRQEYHTGRDFQPVPPAAKEKLEEFDFAKSREEFERHRAEFEKARAEVKSESTRKYDKSASFFDNISNETRDRRGGAGPRVNRDEQRRADTETFGSEMVGQMRGFRRGRGGRGRYGRF